MVFVQFDSRVLDIPEGNKNTVVQFVQICEKDNNPCPFLVTVSCSVDVIWLVRLVRSENLSGRLDADAGKGLLTI